MDIFANSNIEALKLTSDTTVFSNEAFNLMIDEAVSSIVAHEDVEVKRYPSDILKSKVDGFILKQVFPAAISLILETCKINCSTQQLEILLDDCKFSNQQKEFVNKKFTENCEKIRYRLGKIETPFPHIVDVDWRLDYNLKNNQLNKVMDLNYTVSLKTETTESLDDNDNLIFQCNRNQLQDLVGKLKEAVKAVEKVGQ